MAYGNVAANVPYFSDDSFVVIQNIKLTWRYLCFVFVESFKY